MTKYKCPRCGGEKFEAPAIEKVMWLIDENGEYCQSLEFLDVYEPPMEEEVWTCFNYKCKYSGLGSDFIVEEQNSEN